MRENKLTENELHELRRFRLTTEKSKGDLSFPTADLLKTEALKPLLQRLKSRIEAPNHLVASSILMKRYAFFPVIYLYALTKWNKQIVIDPEDVYLEDAEKNGMWLPEIRIEPIQVKPCSNGNSRDEFREEAIQYLFKNHLYPLITALNRETKVSKMVLWENLAVYMFWLYETIFNGETTFKDRIRSDFHYIFKEAEGALFGPYKHNPLTSFDSKKVQIEEDGPEIRIRKTCCYSYMLLKERESAHCGTCPVKCKLQENARKRREKDESGIKGKVTSPSP